MSDKQERDIETHFRHVDRDGDGYIDSEEFSLMLRELGMNRGSDVVEHAFKAIDSNDNGRIDLKEFSKWWDRHTHPVKEDPKLAANDNPKPTIK